LDSSRSPAERRWWTIPRRSNQNEAPREIDWTRRSEPRLGDAAGEVEGHGKDQREAHEDEVEP
jgi:hypothetical protein